LRIITIALLTTLATLAPAQAQDVRFHDAHNNKDQAWDGRRDAFARVSDHVAALIGASPRPLSAFGQTGH